MKLRYTERALADLEAIQAYIARYNPRASQAVGERIRGTIELLADFPGLGRTRDKETRILPMAGNPYVVYYGVDAKEDEVIILHVRHGRRREPKAGEV